jgi:hypothetical protein
MTAKQTHVTLSVSQARQLGKVSTYKERLTQQKSEHASRGQSVRNSS